MKECEIRCRKCGWYFEEGELAFGSEANGWEHMFSCPTDEVPVKIAAYVVCRLPDDNANYSAWCIKVEAAGKGRWAVRHVGMCLNKKGKWIHEPLPSSRTEKWLKQVRWDSAEEAIAAALRAEPTLTVNGLTAQDVLDKGY